MYAALGKAVILDDAGVRFEATPGQVTISAGDATAFSARPRVEVAALHAYGGRLGVRWWEGDLRARLEAMFPTLPGYIGLHMGAPHWLGTGMTRDGSRITSVTPYVRLDFVPDRGLAIAAMAEPAPMQQWLDALRRATGWS